MFKNQTKFAISMFKNQGKKEQIRFLGATEPKTGLRIFSVLLHKH
jgi:hypothetical protein